MHTQCLQKYLLICLITLMFCPKRSLTTTNDVEDNSNPKVKQKNQKLTHLRLSEPGFNYSESEMEKLKIWPEGIIPYFIDDFSFDITLRQRLRILLGSYSSVTGLDFLELSRVPDDENKRWVLFINRRGVLGCEDYSPNSFTTSGVQRVVLGYDCFGAGGGDLASTVLALAGVPPQHNAPDRDTYITVVLDNIIPEKRDLFNVLKNDEWLFHHVKYDFLSAGHYNFHKYTINGSATIIPQNPATLTRAVGEGNGISRTDIWKIRMMYNFISNNRKLPKASDCSKIFQPGSQFSSFKPLMKDIIIPRSKPAKYLGLPDEEAEELSNRDSEDSENYNNDMFKVKKKKVKKGNDKLDALSDFDTDGDMNGGRIKLQGKVKDYKKRTALSSRFHASKLAALSDFDTDKNNK